MESIGIKHKQINSNNYIHKFNQILKNGDLLALEEEMLKYTHGLFQAKLINGNTNLLVYTDILEYIFDNIIG